MGRQPGDDERLARVLAAAPLSSVAVLDVLFAPELPVVDNRAINYVPRQDANKMLTANAELPVRCTRWACRKGRLACVEIR
jgi:hypothetical protein